MVILQPCGGWEAGSILAPGPYQKLNFSRQQCVIFTLVCGNGTTPGMSHTCLTCSVEFDSSRGLRVHHARAHGETLPNRECPVCGDEFYSEYEQRSCSEEVERKPSASPVRTTPTTEAERRKRSARSAARRSSTILRTRRGCTAPTRCADCRTRCRDDPDEEGLYSSGRVHPESWRHRPAVTGENNPHWDGGKREVDCESVTRPSSHTLTARPLRPSPVVTTVGSSGSRRRSPARAISTGGAAGTHYGPG